VGDAPNDIKASRASGIKVVAAAWAYTTNLQELISMNPEPLAKLLRREGTPAPFFYF